MSVCSATKTKSSKLPNLASGDRESPPLELILTDVKREHSNCQLNTTTYEENIYDGEFNLCNKLHPDFSDDQPKDENIFEHIHSLILVIIIHFKWIDIISEI